MTVPESEPDQPTAADETEVQPAATPSSPPESLGLVAKLKSLGKLRLSGLVLFSISMLALLSIVVRLPSALGVQRTGLPAELEIVGHEGEYSPKIDGTYHIVIDVAQGRSAYMSHYDNKTVSFAWHATRDRSIAFADADIVFILPRNTPELTLTWDDPSLNPVTIGPGDPKRSALFRVPIPDQYRAHAILPFDLTAPEGTRNLHLDAIELQPRNDELKEADNRSKRTRRKTRWALFWCSIGLLGIVLRRPPSKQAALMTALYLGLASGAFVTISAEHRYTGTLLDYPGDFASKFRSSNLNSSLLTAIAIRRGQGVGYPGTTLGKVRVLTYRMPGHALFLAASSVWVSNPENIVGMARAGALGQALLWMFGFALFGAVSGFIFEAWRPALAGSLVVLHPSSIDRLQADSVILPLGLLVVSALLVVYFTERHRERVPWWAHLVVHLAFSCWLVVRTDVLIAWIVVSLLLHLPRYWRRLWMPIACVLLIGVSWGFAKVELERRHGREMPFQMFTANTGHVAFVGLWQVPEHKFRWTHSDSSYDSWIKQHDYRYAAPETASFATRGVLRFYLTYPGYVISLTIHKMRKYFTRNAWTGHLSRATPADLGRAFRYGLLWSLSGILFVALLIGYHRRWQLIGWSLVLFNLPLFFILQESAGRFVTFPTVAITLFASLTLLDAGFWRLWFRQAYRAVPFLVLWVTLFFFVDNLDEALLASDSFRYSTPFLDPAHCSLSQFK